jgi:hypothetical protein
MEYKSNIQEDSNYIKLLVKNVGIGTESPGSYRLNVNGNTNITGTLTVTGSISGSAANLTNFPTFNQNTSGNAGTVVYAPNRTDLTAYPVLWGSGTSTTQAYSCAQITIQSSTGTLNATTLSATNASMANNIKLGSNHYFRRIILPYPVIGNNAGAGRWFVRLYQTSAGASFAGGRIRVGGDWNWAPIMGVLEIEFGIYTSLNATSIDSGQTRLSAAVASATDSLRIGNIVVVDGWVGVYIWASNSSTPYVLFDMYSTITPSFTSTAWEANTLPTKRSTEIIGDISATTFIGALTGTATNATNADTVDSYHASTTPIGNHIVVRDPNGYIFGNYINMSDNGNPGGLTAAITSFITKQGDDYYRSVSPTNAMDSIKSVASGSWSINITGNATSATSATRLDPTPGLTTQVGSGTLIHSGQINNNDLGLFPATDNSNSIITVNRHPGDYYSQLGFSSNGKIYYRSFSATAINTSQAWRTVIDSSNINTTYAPTLLGGGASGDWGINITGNAATSTNSSQLGSIAADRYVFGDGANGRSKFNANANVSDSTNSSGFYFGNTTTGMPSTDWWNWLTVAGNSWSGGDGYRWQMAGSFWSDDWRLRRQTSGGWNSWVNILHSGNYSSYALPLSGGTLTGALSGTSATFSGNVTALGFFNTSDARLKNIVERDGDTIKFTWKDGRDSKIHIGYVAQEVQEKYPDQVTKEEDGMLTVNYIEVLVAKIQELENRIKQLEK